MIPTEFFEEPFKEEKRRKRSISQAIREDYGEKAYREYLNKEEDHEGDKPTPLDSGYSGPD